MGGGQGEGFPRCCAQLAERLCVTTHSPPTRSVVRAVAIVAQAPANGPHAHHGAAVAAVAAIVAAQLPANPAHA